MGSYSLMRISYNPSAFGSSIVDNGNIQIVKGENFEHTSYLEPIEYVVDQTSSVFTCVFGTHDSLGYQRTQLTYIPITLLHFKIKVSQCHVLSNINFTDISFANMWSYYTMFYDDDMESAIPYDITNFSGAINDKMCEPVITSFTDYIPAGIGETLTIEGRYFGDDITVGDIIFKDANRGDVYPKNSADDLIGIDDYDKISWSDNRIEITLPYIFDELAVYANPLSEPTEANPIPGSGNFKVKNKYGYYGESQTELTIPYSTFQSIDNRSYLEPPIYEKVNFPLSDENGNGGYTIHLSEDLVNTYPNAKDVVRQAIKDWTCFSGISWELGDDVDILAENDGICVIGIDNNLGSALQATYKDLKMCVNGTEYKWYLKSFDININSAKSWQVNTSGDLSYKYDFYHALAHELGHAHLLGHANDELKGIMFWSANKGPYLESQRKQVESSFGAILGAPYVTEHYSNSILICNNSSHVISLPENCEQSIRENNKGEIKLKVSPNPISNGAITIHYKSDKNSNTQFQLYDSMGQNIKSYDIGKVLEINKEVPVNDLQNGIYFIKVISNNTTKSIKFIVQH